MKVQTKWYMISALFAFSALCHIADFLLKVWK